MRKLAAAFIAGALLFAGCSAESSQSPAADFTSLTDFYAQAINWEKCGRYQCAELLVPIDYDNLEAGVFKLALTKVAARKSNERIGNIVVNPGGPGGSGIEFAQGGTRTASEAILDKFDLIGFDPRGVGKSDPIKCFTDSETDEFLAADETPDTQAEVEVWNNWVDRFALACKEQNPTTWMHVGSWNVARDMDILREALGDAKLDWLGKSYGTLLGALYAELFPAKVGRFVLDGPVDPDNDSDQSLVQIKAFELALKRFITDCLAKRSCPLTGDAESAYQQLLDFIDALDQAPIELSDSRLLTQSHAQTAVLIGLYDDKDLWPFLRDALEFAFTGDGEYLMLLADLINNRDSDGTYLDNSLAALYAVNCVDFAKALKPNELPAEVERLSKESRFFGPLFGWGSSACLGWMNEDLEVVAKLSANPASPVLIVGTEFDPATPIQWAQSLAAQVKNSIVVSWIGDGHTAYRRGSKCVDQLIDSYFIGGALPTTGTICPAISRN
jgi:pimeloyl-ACP methyl ester carboxylesterase